MLLFSAVINLTENNHLNTPLGIYVMGVILVYSVALCEESLQRPCVFWLLYFTVFILVIFY